MDTLRRSRQKRKRNLSPRGNGKKGNSKKRKLLKNGEYTDAPRMVLISTPTPGEKILYDPFEYDFKLHIYGMDMILQRKFQCSCAMREFKATQSDLLNFHIQGHCLF